MGTQCLDSFPSTLGGTRPSLRRLLQVVCSTHSLLPSRFFLQSVSFNPRHLIKNSPDSSLYKGTYMENPVAIKEIFLLEGAKWNSPTGKMTLKVCIVSTK